MGMFFPFSIPEQRLSSASYVCDSIIGSEAVCDRRRVERAGSGLVHAH